MDSNIGAVLIVVGVAVILLGVAVSLGWMSWFGNLPGDISIERGSVRVYAPIVSMLLVSFVLSLLIALLRR